ncbi:MAG: hypothetical protein IPK71_16350 [Myxococcales bacterium]|nr:hypothetical protein [Myxococcales bacterium]
MGTHHRTAIASGLLFTVIGAIGLGACVSDTAEMPPIPDGSTPTPTTPPPPLPELDAAADAADAAIPPLPPPPPPKQDEVTEQFGIFVSANGAPGAAGTRAAPVSTISEGITLAKAAKKRVYVCASTYAEALELLPGVSIVGNMDCATDPTKWTISQANTIVASPTSPAITAREINVPTRIDGLDVIAPAGNDTEPSSIGLLAVNSTGLTFVGGKIEAQSGANGKNGEAPEGFLANVVRTAEPPRANSACIAGLGAGSPCRYSEGGALVNARPEIGLSQGGQVTCQAAGASLTAAGGEGGVGRLYRASQGSAVPYAAPTPGKPGVPDVTPAQPAGGASSFGGTFGEGEYRVGDGTQGGQAATASAGGAGGFGSAALVPVPTEPFMTFASSGGGGGAGGCPGRAGTPGRGGGASIAVLTTRSPLRLEKTVLRAGNGGNGGRGSFGSAPTLGQAGAGAGAAGAPGVQAGASGHGAGGPSIAIVHDTTVPTQVQCQLAHGAAGVSPGEQTQPGTFPGQPARTIPAATPAIAQDTFKY